MREREREKERGRKEGLILEHYKDIIVVSGDIDQDQISCQQNTGPDLDGFISLGYLTVPNKNPTDIFTCLHLPLWRQM